MERLVRHNREQSRFEFGGGADLAVCEYQERDGVWHFTHTFVPNEFRGQGVAGELVRFALDTAQAEEKTIVPECSFVAAFVERHPEFQSLLPGGTDR